MNKFIKTFILGLIILIGIGIFANSVEAGDDFRLELVSPPWDNIFGGETKTAELKIINNTGHSLDGEAIFSATYRGEIFRGDLRAIRPSLYIFGKWIDFSEWQDGETITSEEFIIPKGDILTNFEIKAHSALMPGNYSFIFTMKGTAEEIYTAGVIIGGGGGGGYSFTRIEEIEEQEEEELAESPLDNQTGEEEEEEEEEPSYVPEGTSAGKEEAVSSEAPSESEERRREEEEPSFAEASAGKEEIVEGEETELGWLLAAIGDLFRLGNLWWLLLLFIIIILYWLFRKKKRKEE